MTPILAFVLSFSSNGGKTDLPAAPQVAVGHPAAATPHQAPPIAARPDWQRIDEYVGIDSNLSFPVVVTAYSSTRDQCDRDPLVTASNTRVRPGIVALSRDLLKRYNPDAPFDWGDRIHLVGIGDFIVEDSMNARFRNRVDIWFPDRKTARGWGLKRTQLVIPPGADFLFSDSGFAPAI